MGARQAALQPRGSLERLLLVAAYAVSGFQVVSAMMCSLPCMGETFEVHAATPGTVCNPHHVSHTGPCAAPRCALLAAKHFPGGAGASAPGSLPQSSIACLLFV